MIEAELGIHVMESPFGAVGATLSCRAVVAVGMEQVKLPSSCVFVQDAAVGGDTMIDIPASGCPFSLTLPVTL